MPHHDLKWKIFTGHKLGFINLYSGFKPLSMDSSVEKHCIFISHKSINFISYLAVSGIQFYFLSPNPHLRSRLSFQGLTHNPLLEENPMGFMEETSGEALNVRLSTCTQHNFWFFLNNLPTPLHPKSTQQSIFSLQ